MHEQMKIRMKRKGNMSKTFFRGEKKKRDQRGASRDTISRFFSGLFKPFVSKLFGCFHGLFGAFFKAPAREGRAKHNPWKEEKEGLNP